MLAVVVALALTSAASGADASTPKAVAILPLLADGSVSVKQAHGVTALVRKAVDDGAFAKLLKETGADDADAQKCQRDPKCLGKIADVRGADLIVSGIVTPSPDGLRVALVVIRASGADVFRRAEATLQGNSADDGRIDRLARTALAPESLRGALSITGDEGAAVAVDGKPVGVLPLDDDVVDKAGLRALSEGDHEVVVSKEGYQTLRRTVSIVHKQTAEMKAVLLGGMAPLAVRSHLDDPNAPAQTGPASHTDAIVVGSIGGGLAVLGLVAGALSLKDTLDVEARAKAQQLAFPQNSDLYAQGQIFAYTADGLYAAALLAGGVAAFLWMSDAPASPQGAE